MSSFVLTATFPQIITTHASNFVQNTLRYMSQQSPIDKRCFKHRFDKNEPPSSRELTIASKIDFTLQFTKQPADFDIYQNGMLPLFEDGKQVHDDYWGYIGPPTRVGSVVLEPLHHPCSKEDIHDHFQPFTNEDLADLDQGKGDFYADLGQHVLPSPRVSLEVHSQPCFSTSNAGFNADLEQQTELVVAGTRQPHVSSPREHFELHLEGISQAFVFQILADLSNCLGLPCEDLNAEIFQPYVSLDDAKFMCQISSKYRSLCFGWCAMMLKGPRPLLVMLRF